jgi:MYXO-CTERM domain-containing protein
MYDKPPYSLPGNDLYYQCADLILREGGAGAEDAGGCECVAGEPNGRGLVWLLLFAIGISIRRRSRR